MAPLVRLTQRLFNTPHLIHPDKLAVIIDAV